MTATFSQLGALGILIGIGATPVTAAEHEIIMLGSSFFPTVSYVDAGDTLRFINESDTALTVTAAGGLWTTGEIASAAEALIVVPSLGEGVFYGDLAQEITGQISFGTPPLND